MNGPLVTCIMPVGELHARFIPQAVACFQAQTYRHKRLVMMHGYNEFTLGQIRNRMAFDADAGLICHWDVDDWSGPDRIAQQVNGFESMVTRVVAFNSILFWDERTRQAWRFTGCPPTNIGTSLMYTREWWLNHRFPADRTIAEDRSFILEAHRAGVLATMDGGSLMVARNHQHNTCQRPEQPAESAIADGQWTRVEVRELPDGFMHAAIVP